MNIREFADEMRIPLIFEERCGVRAIYEGGWVRFEGIMTLKQFQEFTKKVKEALCVERLEEGKNEHVD